MLFSFLSQQHSQPTPQDATFNLTDLLPSADDALANWPVLGSELLTLGVYAGRALANDGASPLKWGAYQTDRVLSGQWWRVFTYTLVYDNGFKLFSDAVAIALFGTALSRLQSSDLAFATFRLGLLVGLLGAAFKAPRDEVVTSVSGPAYSMLGSLLATAAFARPRLRLDTGRDRVAGAAFGLSLAALAARPLFASSLERRSQIYALLSGAGAAGIAHLVQAIENR